MSSSEPTNEETGDDVLTQKDLERFDSLFTEADRLTMTPDWADALLRQADADNDADFKSPLAGGVVEPTDFDAVVVDLTAERTGRSVMSAAIAAAMALFVAGIAFFSFSGDPSLFSAEEVPLIPASQQVPPPTASEVTVPVGTQYLSQSANGDTVAVVERDGSDETILATTNDLDVWQETTPVPVVDAAVDVSTDTWYVVGGDSASLSQFGLSETSKRSTELAAFSSSDRGATWQSVALSVGEPEFFVEAWGLDVPSSVQTIISPDFLSVAVLNETVVVVYEKQLAVNWSELASSVGLVEDDTHVFVAGLSSNGYGGDLYALGDDGIELLAADRETFGFSGVVYRELLRGPVSTDETARIQVSVAGEAFVDVPFPRELIGFPSLSAQDDRFVLSGVSTINQSGLFTAALTSTDGVAWSEPVEPVVIEDVIDAFISPTPTAGIFAGQGDWRVSLDRNDSGLTVEQAIGGESPTLVPTPGEGVAIHTAFATDFGAAIVWQDARPVASMATVTKDGYTFDVDFFQANFSVTDPGGNLIIERQNMGGVLQGPGFFEQLSGSIHVVNDRGDLVVSLSQQEIGAASLLDAVSVNGEAPERFISWASSPEDWQSFPLEGLDSNVWTFTPTEGGLLATALEDPTNALLFGWPEQFGE